MKKLLLAVVLMLSMALVLHAQDASGEGSIITQEPSTSTAGPGVSNED
jgi:hypothetical protein